MPGWTQAWNRMEANGRHPGSSLEKHSSSGWKTAEEVGRPFFCTGKLRNLLSIWEDMGGFFPSLMICKRL